MLLKRRQPNRLSRELGGPFVPCPFRPITLDRFGWGIWAPKPRIHLSDRCFLIKTPGCTAYNPILFGGSPLNMDPSFLCSLFLPKRLGIPRDTTVYAIVGGSVGAAMVAAGALAMFGGGGTTASKKKKRGVTGPISTPGRAFGRRHT